MPCVAGPPHLACLAAAPLVASGGEAAAGTVYGSLVVADTQPRTFSTVQLDMLAFSAGSLVRDLEWAAQARRRGQAQQAQQALVRCVQTTVQAHAGGCWQRTCRAWARRNSQLQQQAPGPRRRLVIGGLCGCDYDICAPLLSMLCGPRLGNAQWRLVLPCLQMPFWP